MDWHTLECAIIKECTRQRKNSQFISDYVKYAENLFLKKLPIISSPHHFSQLVGLDHDYVCRMAFSKNEFYRHFTIKKSNGKDRIIDEPLPDLKFVQKWILDYILTPVPVSEYAKAYVKKRNIKHNARFHRKQPVVITMDIKDFFPSISVRDVTSIFKGFGYYDDVSMFLAYLCCYHYSLPQGAPTSPCLSNLRLRVLDAKIDEYILPKKIRYTRYADDLTFSGAISPRELIRDVSDMIYNEGFSINSEKTRVAHKNARQEVTGIVVNSHMQLPKEQRKKIRQEVYYIKKFGLESHLFYTREIRKNYLSHLIGVINFACFVNPKDTKMKEYYMFVKNLLSSDDNDD